MDIPQPNLLAKDHSAQSDASSVRIERAKANDVLGQIRKQMANNKAYAPNRFSDSTVIDVYTDGIQDQFQYGIQAAEAWKNVVGQGGAETQTLHYGNGKASWLNLAASAIGLAVPFADSSGMIDRKGFLQLFDPQGQLSQKLVTRLMYLVDKVDGVKDSKPKGKRVVSIPDVLPLIEFFDRGGGKAMPDFRITVQERLSALTKISQQLGSKNGDHNGDHWKSFSQSLQKAYNAMICPLAQPEVPSDSFKANC